MVDVVDMFKKLFLYLFGLGVWCEIPPLLEVGFIELEDFKAQVGRGWLTRRRGGRGGRI